MATSNSRDFDLDVAEIIEEAYERCGLEVRTGYDARTARRSMNLMFADWANRGLNLWTVAQGTQALTSGTATYTLTSNFADLLEVIVRDSSNTDLPLTKISRGDYLNLTNKTTTGRLRSISLIDKPHQQLPCGLPLTTLRRRWCFITLIAYRMLIRFKTRQTRLFGSCRAWWLV